ncbi:hypothetical protein BU17DRAFT_41819 [Hysterangium stoloniferum]|nr:hypothetical protein BU17DRAFT_41819 [Hysterangium stoloniferum]
MSLASMKSFLGSVNPRDRSSDHFNQLRTTLENTIPSRKSYSPFQIKSDVLSALFNAFWGPYFSLFVPGATSPPNMRSFLSEIQAKHPWTDPPIPGRSCGRVFQKGECCYRCKDCSLDDSSVMCSQCFRATQHEGHNITFYISHQAGGCCDCGDSESWRIRPNCPYHPPGTSRTPRAYTTSTPASTMDVWSPSKHPTRTSTPLELRESMARTIAYAVDYALDTLTNSPDDIIPPHGEHELRTQESGDPFGKEVYAVLLWNDEKHSFEEVINNVCEATGLPRYDVAEIVDRIDEEGREVVETSEDILRLLDVGTRLHQIDLGVTIRRTYDTYREQISALIIEWLLDLTRCRVGTDPFLLRELISAELLNPRKKDISLAYNRIIEGSKSYSDSETYARLDWLFLYHTKWWKKPRLSLKQLYVSIITLGHDYRTAMGSHFASIYHRVIENFLLIDREGDTSVKYFALQIYTVPTIAEHVVRYHNLIPRLLAIVTAFATEQITGTRINFPPDPNQIVDPDSKAFKSKRFMPVFTDLRYLCGNHTIQRLVVSNSEYITSFSKVCQMFMGINPNQRAKENHVEYESDTWINVFNVTLSLSRVVKVYGEAYGRATVGQLVEAIGIVVRHTMTVCTLQENRLDRTKYRSIIPHIVEFNKTTYTVVKFDVLESWVSFHHALHWLLAELFKHVNLLGSESLRTIGYQNLRSVLLRNSGDLDVLTLIDFPLRVVTMIAQIRAGLWVRNGFAIRGQLLHYRDFMLRELCYDQDLFILQTAFVVLDPGLVLVSILDRFQLRSWFSGEMTSRVYDDNHLPSMVEEFLYVIITCLSETGNARRLPMEGAVRRELVHALAVGSCGFTEICKRVPERMVEEVCFEGALMDVAHFRFPESTTDSGLYELKDECFDEVNPYFYHYARNKREEVDAILRARAKKKTGSADMVFVPQPLDIKFGQFVTLTNAFQSSVLHQIIFFAVFNVSNNQGKMTSVFAEAILDQALHLVILGIIEQPQIFSRQSAHVTYELGGKQSLIDVLCFLEHKDTFKALKAKIGWCLDHFSQNVPSIIEKRKIPDTKVKNTVEEAKKRAVKARQDAIMKQFAAAQKDFLDNFDEDDEDEEMEDATEQTQSFQSYGPCIVCQEALDNTQPFGTLGLVQASRLTRQAPDHSTRHLNEVLGSSPSLDRVVARDTRPSFEASKPGTLASTQTTDSMYSTFNAFPREFTRFGMHGSACGHMMHVGCFATYTAAVRQRHRVQAQRSHPENIQRKEFICPLCKSLGNIILPVVMPMTVPLEAQSFPDWVRTTGINLLRSTPDRLLESLHFKSGSGEFVFWAAQDFGYPSFPRHPERIDPLDTHKMVDTVMVAARTISSQSRHLRDRVEQEPGDRGVGMYLPEDLAVYTLASIETAARGTPTLPGQTVADQLTEFQSLFIRGLVACLTKLAALQFKDRSDGGRETIRHAIVKRLLPEWRRETAFNSPLLLREPLTIIVEMAAVSPESLRYVTILAYYASLARITIGIVQLLMKSQHVQLANTTNGKQKDLFGDLGTFVMSVVRHSPLLEHSAELILETFGEERFSKLLYHYSLPFLRRAAVLRKAIHPASLSSTRLPDKVDEYGRLLHLLGIPALATLSAYDTIQNALSGWCAHYGFLHISHPLECGIILDYPLVYHLAELPYYLDDLFESENGEMLCLRCETVPQDPAICLICGITVCLQSHCCVDAESRDRGECNMHTRDCAGVVGAYFMPKRCAILYLFGGSGSFAPAPYLDVHGEVDFSMRRGRRQCLHDVRVEEIRKLWLNHGIPTYIARKMDATIDVGGWESL